MLQEVFSVCLHIKLLPVLLFIKAVNDRQYVYNVFNTVCRRRSLFKTQSILLRNRDGRELNSLFTLSLCRDGILLK